MNKLEKLNTYILRERKEKDKNTIDDKVRSIYLEKIINSKDGKKLLSNVAETINMGGCLSNASIQLETSFLGENIFRNNISIVELLDKLSISRDELEKCMLLQFKDVYLNEYVSKNNVIPTRKKFQDYLLEKGIDVIDHFTIHYSNGFSKKKLLENHIMFNTNYFKAPKFKNNTNKFLGNFRLENYSNRYDALYLGFTTIQRWIQIPLTLEILKKELSSNISSLEYETLYYSYQKERLENYYIEGYINDFKVKETFPEQFATAILVYLYESNKEKIAYEPFYKWFGQYTPDFELENTFLEIANWKGKSYKKRLIEKEKLVKSNSIKNYEVLNLNFKAKTLKEVFEDIKTILIKNNEPINSELEFENCDFKSIISSGKANERSMELENIMKYIKEISL